MTPPWSPASPGEFPLTDSVQIWRVSLLLASPAAGGLAAQLVAEEAEQARRFRREEDRQRFVAGRGALRVLLAGLLGVAPRTVQFAQNHHGKPMLAGNRATHVSFNVAHSGQVVLVALNAGAEVGVDVEAARALPDALELANRFFAPAESAALAAAAETERPAVFLRLWTRKEALLKALGTGIGADLAKCEVTSGVEAAARRVADDPQAAAGWTLRDFQPAPNHFGCVAVHRPQARFAFYELKVNIPS